jgi:hypothetical protein
MTVSSKAREKATDSQGSDCNSDYAFEELSEFFSAKSTKGQKNKAARKPVEEIGPSGEPYTPLEKQVNLSGARPLSLSTTFVSGSTS